jgi:hypothetical protein
MGRFSRLFLVLLLALSTVSGQNTAPPQLKTRPSEPPPPPPGGTDRQITLDVQVADKSGAPVRGLRKQDFALLDDKQPKNILSFRAVDSGAASATDPLLKSFWWSTLSTLPSRPSPTAELKSRSFCCRMAAISHNECRSPSFPKLGRRFKMIPLAMVMPWRRSMTNTRPGCVPVIGISGSVLTCRSRP